MAGASADRLAGLLALVLLATCPLYYGHMFMNPKDSPFAVAMAIFLLGLVRCFEEYPRPSIATGALVGAGFGLAFGSRIMGAFGATGALAALALIVALEWRADGLRWRRRAACTFCLDARARSGTGLRCNGVDLALVRAAIRSIRCGPLNTFRAFSKSRGRSCSTGALISVPDMPRSYVPTLFALKLPADFLNPGASAAPRERWSPPSDTAWP